MVAPYLYNLSGKRVGRSQDEKTGSEKVVFKSGSVQGQNGASV